ncbi:uncharacterized protein [Miscanthus floridulus]|uniref:uncharacterized protein n=1 Tax=Miscanthus floridulus TaxID=154761 RepID=UPI003458A4E7
MTIEATTAEARAPRTTEATMAEAGAPGTTEATMVEAEAPGTIEADVIAARPLAQEVEMEAMEASVAPLGQGPPSLWESAREVEVLLISSDDTSPVQEMVDAKVAGTVEQPSWDDPEVEPLFTLEDAVEGGCWDTFEQYHQLAERSLRTALSMVADDLPEVAQVEAATAQEQVAPLAALVKELEEELTHMAGDRDAFRSRAEEAMASGKALAGQLGAEQSAHQLTKELGREASRAVEGTQVEAQCLKEKAEASQAKALRWKEKAESEAKVTWAAEASVAVQAVLETEIGEHNALKDAARIACEALGVEGVQSSSSLGSHLIALSGQVRERL